jgi:glycosyltransferase involved in cell wall biosynthesis
MTEHFKDFVSPTLWPKLRYLYTATPSQPTIDRTKRGDFTILTIGNRFSDKGIPEALNVYHILRQRHGRRVKMLLACNRVPQGYRLPEGVTLYDRRRMSAEVQASFYRSADVALLPIYWDAGASLVEPSAFGLPTVTTRIHHGEAYVQHGITGYLVEAPMYVCSPGYGTRWRDWPGFLRDLDAKREGGAMASLVEDATDLLEEMVSGMVDHAAMGRTARKLHAERFSPEVRNRELRTLYENALS